MRAMFVQPKIASTSAMVKVPTPLLRAVKATIAPSTSGSAKKISVTRESTSSIQPPT